MVVLHQDANFSGMDAPTAYILFTFTLMNASVFEVLLDESQVNGHIGLDDARHPLAQTPELSEPRGTTGVRHGGTIRLRLRQFLPPNEANRIPAAGSRVRFDFSELDVLVKASNDVEDEAATHRVLLERYAFRRNS